MIQSQDVLPPEFLNIYDEVYNIVKENAASGTIKSALPRIISSAIMLAMQSSEHATTSGGEKIKGSEKKKMALALIKKIVSDMSKDGTISDGDAKFVLDNIDFWGGMAMDIAISAIKKVFDIGQEFVESGKLQELTDQNCSCCSVM